MNATPIPANIWARILTTLIAGFHGQVVLFVVDGRVVRCEIVESIKAGSGDSEGCKAA